MFLGGTNPAERDAARLGDCGEHAGSVLVELVAEHVEGCECAVVGERIREELDAARLILTDTVGQAAERVVAQVHLGERRVQLERLGERPERDEWQ